MTITDDIESRSPPKHDDGAVIYRHRIATRVTHWTWAIALFFLLLSGLQIFNAHPTLYIGQQSGAVEAAAGLGVVLIWSTLSPWAQLCVAWLVVEALFYLLQCFRCVDAAASLRNHQKPRCTVPTSYTSTTVTKGLGTCPCHLWLGVPRLSFAEALRDWRCCERAASLSCNIRFCVLHPGCC